MEEQYDSDSLEVYHRDTLKKATIKELKLILQDKLPKEDFILLCCDCYERARWLKEEQNMRLKKNV